MQSGFRTRSSRKLTNVLLRQAFTCATHLIGNILAPSDMTVFVLEEDSARFTGEYLQLFWECCRYPRSNIILLLCQKSLEIAYRVWFCWLRQANTNDGYLFRFLTLCYTSANYSCMFSHRITLLHILFHFYTQYTSSSTIYMYLLH